MYLNNIISAFLINLGQGKEHAELTSYMGPLYDWYKYIIILLIELY